VHVGPRHGVVQVISFGMIKGHQDMKSKRQKHFFVTLLFAIVDTNFSNTVS